MIVCPLQLGSSAVNHTKGKCVNPGSSREVTENIKIGIKPLSLSH